ncbi:hypothetical protein APP_29400 [Aeribacillus pallidus]|nr:hypothetical protein APP_29400 [Aeribacillus pallidus]
MKKIFFIKRLQRMLICKHFFIGMIVANEKSEANQIGGYLYDDCQINIYSHYTRKSKMDISENA